MANSLRVKFGRKLTNLKGFADLVGIATVPDRVHFREMQVTEFLKVTVSRSCDRATNF